MVEVKEEILYIIPDLKELVEPHIVCDKSKILTARYSPVKNTDDKYGLLWLKVHINLINTSTGEEWSINLIAKSYPKNIENRDFIQIDKIFQKEIGIYMTARSTLEQYLKQKGIRNGADFFPTPYGGRKNVYGGDSVDNNAVLLLQNYDALGFKVVPRRTGFDLETSKCILKALGKFHGTFLGYKDLYPKQFDEKVKIYLSNSYIPENVERMARTHLIQVLKEKDFPLDVIERAVATFDRKNTKEVREPWGTMTHNNTWVNNVLVKHEKNGGGPKFVKFIDYSLSEYNSPLTDFLFFLFSSVELGILKTNLDDLIDYYYYSYISILKRLNNESCLGCRLAFNRELKTVASSSEFYRIICMLYTVLATQHLNCDNSEHTVPELQDVIHKRRLCYIINTFENRGWLHL